MVSIETIVSIDTIVQWLVPFGWSFISPRIEQEIALATDLLAFIESDRRET
jgi:hypothetical protein